jgi:hypothetical protein
MSNHTLSKETNKEICNVYHCQKKATENIKISAGKFGEITLNLCSGCTLLFATKEAAKNEI